MGTYISIFLYQKRKFNLVAINNHFTFHVLIPLVPNFKHLFVIKVKLILTAQTNFKKHEQNILCMYRFMRIHFIQF